ncbi:MAG: FG-GAP repeat protein [Methylococcaceae bacterium]
MKLSAIGYQTLQVLHSPQKISQQDDTVSYQWNETLRERWINSEQQLEQWFDIAHRPEGPSEGFPLTVQITLDSELKISQQGNGLSFTGVQGTQITYNKLKVWDSTGRELPARMQLVANTLNLLVDDSNARYPVTIDPIVSMPSVQQQAYLKASSTRSYDFFGYSVAISGDTLVVGAKWEDSDSTGVDGNQNNRLALESGAAYVFTRSGTSWTQQAYLKASNTGGFDWFGYSVAISGDTLVVGARLESSDSTGVDGDQNNNLASWSGAAYVFTRSGTNWTQQAYLKASNTDAGGRFGESVAISGDTLVVGAYYESPGVDVDPSNGLEEDSGAAYVFTRSGTSWTQQAYLKASNTSKYDYFGYSVAISGDTLVVGAYGDASDRTGVDGDQNNSLVEASGAAYVFTRSGTNWTQQAYLKASNTSGHDLFGRSVAISGDTLVVGADGEASDSTGVNGDQNNDLAGISGAAYVFTRSGTSWTQQAYLKASNTGAGDFFGESVAISGDTLVVWLAGKTVIAREWMVIRTMI